jgi:hypothetical protein
VSLLSDDDIATAIGRSGIQLKSFDDGSLAVLNVSTKQAMHFGPDQALQLRDFVRLFDRRAEPKTLLTEARDIVYGDREQTHGEPGKNLRAIAAMWSPIFDIKVTEQQVLLAMIALKVARAINTPRHRDHWVDIAGYVALAERTGHVAPS